MVQEEYVFEDQHQPKKSGIGKFIWNSEKREFLGRDGASWGKITLFYAIFYTCLGSFFVGLLALFIKFMPVDRPTYIGEDSTMANRGLNPGLGFRPHVDVEDFLISFNPKVAEHPTTGYLKYVNNLENFLNAKYPKIDEADQDLAIDCKANTTYSSQLEAGKACRFDYEEEFKSTVCNKASNYGYTTNKPCVLVKLNKIFSWTPEGPNGVRIRCEGETSSDQDNLKQVSYHSIGDIDNQEFGSLDKKFFPFYGQKAYRAPFVWVQFDVSPNTLINIECKAYADNIDNEDRMNRRGQTKFAFFISNKN
ncbi:sodium potassium-transporting ATPase subunit beta-3 [Brachionus plicatilis]|uniref:Sodium potassium-transporting ATPase subunit beta-3 n=1 Tax=Brachionus plicatilis TaxID=10195 RepID=A0A3M7RBV4_BRAPC|nr:sodium potassium-transporting ATPase subunit beta-3 [Brachionus plicatilis]